MRIKTVAVAEKLIEEQFDQLEYAYRLLEIQSQLDRSKGSEASKLLIHASESNLKYYCFVMSSFLDLLVILKGFLNSNSRWEDVFLDIPVILTPHSGHIDPLRFIGQKDKNVTNLQFFS